MKILASAILTLALMCVCPHANADTFGTGANQFEIEFVEIGDPGNAPDTSGDPNPAGSVDYVYRIGKYEISRETIERANAEGGLELTSRFVPGRTRPAMPATEVSWNEAARFTNWLNTSQGSPEAYKFATKPGEVGYNPNENILLWEPPDAGYDVDNRFRNSQAKYFLPSVNEWYKAAYFDPDANGGVGEYWDFPTGSDHAPREVASGTDAETAVIFSAEGPADITQAGGLSPYGVMGLGGNVWEWAETEFDLTNHDSSSVRDVRGGFFSSSEELSASNRVCAEILSVGCAYPTHATPLVGFRVASIPEPSSLQLGWFGILGLLQRRRHRRR